MNTSGFHQNVGEGNKSLNAMSPDPLLSEAFSNGSGFARLHDLGDSHYNQIEASLHYIVYFFFCQCSEGDAQNTDSFVCTSVAKQFSITCVCAGN